MWGHANVAKWKITERKNEFYLAGLDPMTNSCRKRQLSLMPSAAYVSPIAHTPRGETHSYTQGCRLHNTSASWKPGQYYWLTQDTGSSQSSSWSDPVPCLLAPIFICLSLQSIIQQAVSDLPQIFILLKLLQTKTHHAQNNFFARKIQLLPLYTWYTNRPVISQPCHSLDTLTHARTHQKLPRDAKCEKQLKKMWNRRGVTLKKVVTSTANTLEFLQAEVTHRQNLLNTHHHVACANKIYKQKHMLSCVAQQNPYTGTHSEMLVVKGYWRGAGTNMPSPAIKALGRRAPLRWGKWVIVFH